MDVTVFGAAGPTGVWICREALRAGHRVRAVSRRPDPLPDLSSTQLTQVKADAISGAGVPEAVEGADAVLSALGASYTRHPVSVYSAGTQRIVDALRTGGRGNRLVVVSSGLTYPPPPGFGFIPDHIVFPLLRNVLGRTLYADMRRMEEFLRESDDISWTIMRPGRLIDRPSVSAYRLDVDHPTQGYTARADLAAAMVAELDTATAHIHQAIAPTTPR
ncbi:MULTISPECIES: NAD(P)-dependent oxidoreductase [Mycobacterium]|uniref:NmrA family transcriptional regulator n=1 Tax=Mycobacterium kiyosense TaxID=2871094 RepID=A0A9P3Q5C1_9MYCO|nr:MULTISPECIES: NAD(P)H-binding protein [Mycobacterium]BDB43337.1 NmrA family transcriptional regulator [Mycobacterium kiyosense]BDE13496.1 NmrA family transcriptional regulator [Mycobacterium sp. 20KCMC460]GLB84166.1 NmrA family transcriptional regulator [Mycobacterium kiyosense]GLB88428.1 NmrA family transcriptional regulator [Mycobacterium kiyosense]GLB94646.1 NmrA family transcriptional regulator [Mycobacterium kiyosense]